MHIRFGNSRSFGGDLPPEGVLSEMVGLELVDDRTGEVLFSMLVEPRGDVHYVQIDVPEEDRELTEEELDMSPPPPIRVTRTIVPIESDENQVRFVVHGITDEEVEQGLTDAQIIPFPRPSGRPDKES